MQQRCDLLAVSRLGFYMAQHRAAKPASCKASIHLKAAFMASHQNYGSRRLATAMASAGVRIARFKVRRLMRQAASKPVWKRKFVHPADNKHGLPVASMLNRQFSPAARNLAYVSDITYILAVAGCAYLATVLDLYTRKVVGWAMAPSWSACFEHGDWTVTAGPRIDRPFGLRQSICQCAVPSYACTALIRLQYEPKKKLLRVRALL